MAKNKIVDISAIIQVIGCVYINPSLIDQNEKYTFTLEDFTEDFHKVIFGSIYNLYQLGAKKIEPSTIEDYLSSYPKKLAIYQVNKGDEYLQKISEKAQPAAFDFYYNRMKKFTLLRMYDDIGLNISDIYDIDNAFDIKKKQHQEEWLNNTDIEEIAETIDKKITDIKLKYANIKENDFHQGGDGIDELIENLKNNPDIGVPLYGNFINTITRGARLGKFYLRSMPTGVGKTRMMVADACYIACNKIYNTETNSWEDCGNSEPTLFIATEQDLAEIQTAMLAFLSAVNEEHILTGAYEEDEFERVKYAASILKESPLYVKELPDFSLKDIENTIKFAVHDWNIKYCLYDYLHSSTKILSEVSSKARVANLREDNVLFMISTTLKELCTRYGIFILTSTQLNGQYADAEVFDQNLLRGAKSIADKCDIGMIGLTPTERDKEALSEIVSKLGMEMPNVKISVYKNRRGRWKDIILWCNADKGTCRYNPMFITNYNYELIEMKNLKINILNFEE